LLQIVLYFVEMEQLPYAEAGKQIPSRYFVSPYPHHIVTTTP